MLKREYFGTIEEVIEPPNLIEVQSKSYEDFLQKDVPPSKRTETGLQAVFEEVFPIKSYDETIELGFVSYDIEDSKASALDALRTGETFSAALYVTFNLKDDTGTKKERVYMGELPMMTRRGTFVINGAERVIVSQLHRSPGICFEKSVHLNGKILHSFRIIPDRGSWLEVQFDTNDLAYVYLDRRRRRRKFLVTTFLRALGYPTERDLVSNFYNIQKLKISEKMDEESLASLMPFEDIMDGEVVVARAYEPLSIGVVRQLVALGQKTVEVIDSSEDEILVKSLKKDPAHDEESALKDIYRKLRPGDPPTAANARALLKRLFFDPKKYDLTRVGRYKINQKLKIDVDSNERIMVGEDFLAATKYLLGLKKGEGILDDIDHLGSRRVRAVGELLANQCRVGLARTERLVKERMTLFDVNIEGMTPQKLINPKALSAVVRDFFGRSQLSQFMDQTNPLSEITHKRRLSALGPGGLSRERAGFEVRDVHYTHYGRLCPIETPEGPNIGLISSLCVYAKVNSMGFIETPYRAVSEGKVVVDSTPTYLSAEEEEAKVIAQANAPISPDGTFINEKVKVREEGDFPVVEPETIDFMDVAPNQIASISASLIPFLEHDDANRALMGSNMMRQAVPLLRPEAPIVGTGLERQVATDSRVLINSEGAGTVEYVDSKQIQIRYDRTEDERSVSFEEDIKTYHLVKFQKTNQGTTINLKPIVRKGDRVEYGQVLCEGYATQKGELALGRNMLVSFMPWKGYNFEDAIVISERVVREDIFTSIHIDEYSLEVRDTKLGAEELTADIPNVSEEATKDLDENGIIRVGAEIKPGDILIGKITPKGESDPSPEEKLLRAIFGDKAGDVKDASLKASPSLNGVVIDKKLFTRLIKDKRQRAEDKEEIGQLDLEMAAELAELKSVFVQKLSVLVQGKTSQGVINDLNEDVIPKGTKFTLKALNAIEDYSRIVGGKWTTDEERNDKIDTVIHNYKIKVNDIQGIYRRKRFAITVGDELPAGIVKLAKVYIAKKRKLKVGDKMAGRHGNKGIVARIVRDEDMPFLEDGTPVDIVLNPLGVPSRMNIGQIYETVLGWAGRKLNKNFATPIFDGASLDDISSYVTDAGLPEFGHTQLYDGGTGQAFDQKATVGIIYMLKLGHMVDDKMHARSIGPYSLITQQPLGGKAQFGGQRFGEMEVWALEAFGAANILREILTVKSDDVVGRAKTYEAIVKGERMPAPGIPESFNVLLHELKGLGLKVTLD